ncbi:MAG TPA: energy transducer TonB [Gallionella sp.]|nr:energy transducer TonB [Gallionella sp.]
MRHWSASLSLHAIAIAALLVMQWELRHATPKESSEWDVSMLESPVVSEQQPTPQIVKQPKAVEPVQSDPAPSQLPPTPVTETEATPPVSTNIPTPIQPQSEPPPDKTFADSSWLTQTLWGLMNARKRYPLMARRMGIEGKVLVEATINEQGQVVQATVKQSSGNSILDADALELLRTVTPLKLDQFKLASNTTVVIPVTYQLEK